MIEKFFLPDPSALFQTRITDSREQRSLRAIRLLVHCFHFCMKIRSGLASSSARQKKCTMFRHDDIAPNLPSHGDRAHSAIPRRSIAAMSF